jgi:D-alanine-D-alanine ligase
MARILIICGGDNGERRVSLAGGDAVARGLATASHDVLKLDTAKPTVFAAANEPLLDGPVGLTPPDELAEARLDRDGWLKLFNSISDQEFDAVFPLLHGTWGEGGQIQAMFELMGIPYLGCDMRSSSLALDKMRTHDVAEQIGLPVAKATLLRIDPANHATFNDAFRTSVSATSDPAWGRFVDEHPHIVVLKPNLGGSTVGITISSQENELHDGLQAILSLGDDPMLEEFIPGREVTVTIIGDHAYPMIEIRPHDGYYDYANKYTHGKSEYLCPAPVDKSVQRQAAEYSEMLFHALGCRHLARVDFRLTEDNQLFLLEINTIPGMTDLSLVPMAAKQNGLDFPALMNRFVELVLE